MKKQSSEVRTSTCAFVYSDGRQCRSLPRYKSLYCLHHERKLHHLREADWTTSHISEHVTHNFVSASALNRSLGRLFAAIADGSIPPKAATQLVNLSKVMLQASNAATRELLMAYPEGQHLEHLIRQAHDYSPMAKLDEPQPHFANPSDPAPELDAISEQIKSQPRWTQPL
ncbi:MAG: hypothetical protein WAM58_01875 [Candidatus Acidiferrum sp.]